MVAWTKQHESGLQTETFLMLLHKLGFHLASDVGKLFPRIPHYWSTDHIYQLVQKLGQPLKQDMKVDLLSVLESTKPRSQPPAPKRSFWASTLGDTKSQGLVLYCNYI